MALMPLRITRCRDAGSERTTDIPDLSQGELVRDIVPLMERPDCFILSYTTLKHLFVENLDMLGLVAYAEPGEDRVYMLLGW